MRYSGLLVILLAAQSYGAITNLRVLGTTATQAVISYNAPDINPCTIQVSEGGSIGTLVHDVDPSIFTGANQDFRPGSIVDATVRTVVIGSRSSQLATAGPYAGLRHYSRALQLNTLHTFQVTCEAGTASTSFTTSSIFPGDTYPDPWFVDPSNPGDQPFPEALGDQNLWSFIDPLTGMYMQEVSTRGDVAGYWYSPNNPIITAHNSGQPPCDSAGPWQSPCNALATGSSAPFSTVGNSTAWLILPVDMNQGVFGGIWGKTSYDFGDVLDQIQFSITGAVSSSNSALRQLDVCLSMNSGASCATQIATMTLPQSPATTQSVGQSSPSQFGIIPWLLDSNPRINRPEFQAHQGQVSVSGSTLTWVSGDPFSTYWFNGGNGTIWLASTSQNDACNFSAGNPSSHATEYPLTSMVDGNHLAISGTPAAGTYYYCTHNSAVMIRRHAADASSTASVQAANLTAISHTALGTTANGESTACYNTLVNGGFFCNIGGLFWVNPVTGSTSWFGSPQLYVKSTGANQWAKQGGCPSVQAAWDQTQPVPTWYCVIMDSAGKIVLIRAQYNGPTTPPTQPRQLSGQINNLSTPTTDDYSQNYGNGALVFTDLTPSSLGQSITDQLLQFDPTFVPGKFTLCPGPSGLIVQQGIAFFSCQSVQGQDTPAWEIAISPGDGVPAHAGTTGAHIIGAINSFSGPQIRWRGTHAIDDLGEQPYFSFGANPYGQMIVTTSTSIPGSGVDCSTYGGATGKSCSLVQINQYQNSYEPYLQGASTPFTGAPGELGAAEPGDTASFGSTSGEVMTLLAKNYGGVQGQWVWQRAGNPVALSGSGQKTIYIKPSAIGSIKWNPATDPHGSGGLVDAEALGSHGYWREGSAAEATVIGQMICSNPLFNAYQIRQGSYPALASAALDYISANPPFAGSCFGVALPNDSQQHPNPPGALTGGNLRLEGFDVRPQLAEGQAPQAGAFSNVSGQLYAYSTTAADADDLNITTQYGNQLPPAVLNRKLVSTAASCGSHPLVDISGPGSLIDGSAANSYKYCIPRVSGECYSGSTLGKIYVNCPNVITTGCSGNGVHGGTVMGMGNDICIYNASAPAQMAVQFGLAANDAGSALERNLTTSIGRLRMTSGFANARLLPDNSWILILGDWLNLNGHDLWMGKMPPWTPDSVSRSKFIPLMLTLTPPAGAKVSNAIVEFGYPEDGAPVSLNCTTRNDVCVANSGNVGAVPFQFLSENPGGAACATSCTIAIPAIPQRVLYYRVFYRDASNNVLAVTTMQAMTTP